MIILTFIKHFKGLPVLFFALVAVIALAAAVPSFFSIGESAKKQQKEFESKDKIAFNSFKPNAKTDKRTGTVDSKKAPVVVVGVKKNFTTNKNAQTASPTKKR